jgi:phosphoribosylanthranilate isomerase
MVRVKICGIRSAADAQLAVSSGADAIGLLVGQAHPSPDFLPQDEARRIVETLPPFVTAAMVTHYEDPRRVAELITSVGPSAVQIHSEMRPSNLALLRREFPRLVWIKSYHVVDERSVAYGEAYQDLVDAFVLDTVDAGRGLVGGTGATHDWDVSAAIVRRYQVPAILAGGLTPENVAEAVAAVRPFGVDVNSGVKGTNGFKDPQKVRDFVARAKSASMQNRTAR